MQSLVIHDEVCNVSNGGTWALLKVCNGTEIIGFYTSVSVLATLLLLLRSVT